MKQLDQEIESANGELNDTIKATNERKDEFQELKELAANKDDLKSEVIKHQRELKSLQTDIKSAEEELAKLEGELIKASDKPIKVSAGYFYFGSDIEPGRYKITAQEGHRGNVFIREEGKRGSYVGETFGDGSRGSTVDFVFESKAGDEIEATIPVYLYPVE
ncbi:hypothetical protein GMD78_08940 [Ornithinibacillus sp. L9]|uniref:Uncharacterized protein n=1 Tax=Ornithinibacillus caprae TaxID=2678566 RepID=A0A6N8FKK6_9BACI|nr:hypothetical protein [Ornithinibacillus caprae]MUK88517.1 hypothetical protein [Ornithinibacillus caprae]